MLTDADMQTHRPTEHMTHELMQRVEHLEKFQSECRTQREVGTTRVQTINDNVENLEKQFIKVQDDVQVPEARTHAKGKQPMNSQQQKATAGCSRHTCDDDGDSSPDDHPRGGIPSSPALLKGVILPHTHEIVQFSQRGAGIKGHPSIVPGLPPWHAAVSNTFRVRTGAPISDNVPAELLRQETIPADEREG